MFSRSKVWWGEEGFVSSGDVKEKVVEVVL